MKTRRGFTLIEVLLVALIMGILLSIASYTYNYATQRARDTKRKNDLFAISMGFEARYKDETCAVQRVYPGYKSVGGYVWADVANLIDQTPLTFCDTLTYFIKTIPEDVNTTYKYKYDLSTDAKHYRLAAYMESASNYKALDTTLWASYGGTTTLPSYNYFIGK